MLECLGRAVSFNRIEQVAISKFTNPAGLQASDGSSVKLTIGFILSRSFTLSAFALFIDTLRLASDALDRSGRVSADWAVLGSTPHLIMSSCGVRVAPTSDFIAPEQFDYLVIVGGLLDVDSPVDRETTNYLRTAAAARVPLIGLCTGTFILADAGLMKDHEACVSWLHHQDYRQRFPDHAVRSDRLFNFARRRGSCAGGSSSADMAAFLVRRHINNDAARNALEVLQIDRARVATDIQPRRPLVEDFEGVDDGADPRIRAAMINMEQHLEEAMSIDALAASVSLSRRQLERIFLSRIGISPAQAYNKIRLKKARLLLLQSDAPLIDIALDVGFGNASHFSRTFKRIYGVSPSQWRSAPEPVGGATSPRP